jgi:hypothetical protein
MTTWQDGDYRITENPEEAAQTRFRLDSFGEGADPEFFASLDQAKRAATTRAELATSKDEIARLRAELDQCRQADAFGRDAPAASPAVAKLAAELVEIMAANDAEHDEEDPQPDMHDHAAYEADGRGIPRARAGTINLHEAGPASPDDWF